MFCPNVLHYCVSNAEPIIARSLFSQTPIIVTIDYRQFATEKGSCPSYVKKETTYK